VLIVDDVLATGGTMKACVDLVTRLGGDLAGIAVLIELAGLGGRAQGRAASGAFRVALCGAAGSASETPPSKTAHSR
jgi:adenine/guanine phosphoribosyltransferase-like PRPP-binding protein